ncbi:putative polysaccharide deacetylase [Lindgomyces ingoldianus]|uniref:Polysaccharide deacetylase n=1 Tax=Lindgomyces ingoldianus TaxID=673940 RepID=A0ACB6QJM2_9PLEO|nr:putative polysaccharide deacetylase [Lindgomyces ingoldianus]KAF2467131.1 putative polysaccharide deacetylase [Lindgomyces ingoldianus]
MFILVTVFLLIVSPFYTVYKPPTLLIKYFQYRWPDVLWQVSTPSKIVALTIDDGPSEYTSQIMEILKENNVAATFFIIGSQVPGKEDVLEDLVRNGNELGNHAMRDEPSRSLSDAELIRQIDTVETLIHRAYDAADLGHPARYFRPGSGFFSGRMRKRLEMLKYRLVLGSIYPHDPQIPYWRVNARHILSMMRPGGIIICHDRRSWTIPMLKNVIPEIKKRGYRITTVSGLVRQAPIPSTIPNT